VLIILYHAFVTAFANRNLARYVYVIAPAFALAAGTVFLIILTEVRKIQPLLWHRHTTSPLPLIPVRMLIFSAVPLIIAGLIGIVVPTLAPFPTSLTAAYLQQHLGDHAILAVDNSVADEVIAATKTGNNAAQNWEWRIVTEPEGWLSDGLQYLVADERSISGLSFEEWVDSMKDRGASVIYEAPRWLGLGPRQAILEIAA
jgi:hypothetical protein